MLNEKFTRGINKIYISFIIFIIFSACENIKPTSNNIVSGKGSVLLELQDSLKYYMEFREINTKYDVLSGEKQCKGYGSGYNKHDEIYLYGFNIRNAIAIVLNLPYKDVYCKDNTLDRYFFEYNYKIKNNNDTINKIDIVNELLDRLNLKMSVSYDKVKAYNIKIIDSFKLKKFTSENTTRHEYSYNNLEASLKGLSVNHLSNYLNRNNNIYHFFSNEKESGIYDFKIIPNTNIKLLNEKLQEIYGLTCLEDSLVVKKITLAQKMEN